MQLRRRSLRAIAGERNRTAERTCHTPTTTTATIVATVTAIATLLLLLVPAVARATRRIHLLIIPTAPIVPTVIGIGVTRPKTRRPRLSRAAGSPWSRAKRRTRVSEPRVPKETALVLEARGAAPS